MARRASIVLITYDSAEYLPRCIEGVLGTSAVELELIQIDNASRDDSLGIVATLLRGSSVALRQIRNDENVGFAAAANQGIRAASSEYILLLNPDVYLEPTYVEVVIAALEGDPRAGTAAGKLLQGRGARIEPTGVVDSVGIRMTRSGRHFDEGHGEPDRWLQREPFEVFGVTGAAMMMRRVFLDDVAIDGDYFDERFFAYREDADLAWRGRIFGWTSLSVPSAVAYHVRRVTPAARGKLPSIINMHSVKNRFLLRLNNQGVPLALRHLPFQLLRDLVVVAAVLIRERSSLPALLWLWRNRRSIFARRRAIQSRRRVADSDLAEWFV